MQTLPTWHPDASQQKILDLKSGKHLVLAPPGCGKTQILADEANDALLVVNVPTAFTSSADAAQALTRTLGLRSRQLRELAEEMGLDLPVSRWREEAEERHGTDERGRDGDEDGDEHYVEDLALVDD